MSYLNTPYKSMAMEAIAVEANVLADMVSTVKDWFPDLFNEVHASFAHLTSVVGFTDVKTQNGQTELNKKDRALLEKLNAIGYTDLEKVTLQVPEGFNASMVDYIQTLHKLSLIHI